MNRKTTLRFLQAAAAFAALSGLAMAAGARVNTSPSLPVGLYWKTGEAFGQGADLKGKLAILCPPIGTVFDEALKRGYIGPGFCPGGYGFVMKQIAAVRGDVVSVSSQGVSVNGNPLPNSQPFEADKTGRAMPYYRAEGYTLGSSEVLLMADYNPWSFDARYFGPVDRSQIRGVIRPVLTW